MDDSAIMCDEVVCDKVIWWRNKNYFCKFQCKNIICKAQNFYILLAFLLATMVLLIAVSIFCYLINYQAKQKHLLPFQN